MEFQLIQVTYWKEKFTYFQEFISKINPIVFKIDYLYSTLENCDPNLIFRKLTYFDLVHLILI